MPPPLPSIARPQLFSLLASATATTTVVTPNRRLAQAVRRGYDGFQAASAQASWETADVLPLAAFVERLWEESLCAGPAQRLPLLLDAHAEHWMWEEAVRASRHSGALLSAGAVASQCREAWRLAHAWQLAPRLARAAGSD